MLDVPCKFHFCKYISFVFICKTNFVCRWGFSVAWPLCGWGFSPECHQMCLCMRPSLPRGEPRCGTQCGRKEPGRYMKYFGHTERGPVSLWYSLCYPVYPGMLVIVGRPTGVPPIVCRYKFQQVFTSRSRMYSLVLLESGGPYSWLSKMGLIYYGVCLVSKNRVVCYGPAVCGLNTGSRQGWLDAQVGNLKYIKF